MMHVGGRILGAIRNQDKGGQYREFNPPRRPEEFVGIAGPHQGLALPHDVLEAIATTRTTGKPHGYLVRGEWVRKDGVAFLDLAVDRSWVVENTDYQLVEGRLRWVCPECAYMSGNHRKGCGHR